MVLNEDEKKKMMDESFARTLEALNLDQEVMLGLMTNPGLRNAIIARSKNPDLEPATLPDLADDKTRDLYERAMVIVKAHCKPSPEISLAEIVDEDERVISKHGTGLTRGEAKKGLAALDRILHVAMAVLVAVAAYALFALVRS